MFRVARSGRCVCVTLTVRCSFTAEPGGPPVSARVCLSVVRAFRPGVDVPALRLSRVRGVGVVRITCAGGCGWSEQRVRRCRDPQVLQVSATRPTTTTCLTTWSPRLGAKGPVVTRSASRRGAPAIVSLGGESSPLPHRGVRVRGSAPRGLSCLISDRPTSRPLAGTTEPPPLPHWGAG